MRRIPMDQITAFRSTTTGQLHDANTGAMLPEDHAGLLLDHDSGFVFATRPTDTGREFVVAGRLDHPLTR